MTLNNIKEFTAARRRFMLIVDSNDRNRQFLSTLLTLFEYDAYAAKTVEEALETVTVMRPVLVVTARQLDDGNDALALISSIRKADPEHTPPVIVLSAKSDPAFERACLDAGALTFLRTPITFENFYRVIQVAIEPIPRMTIRIGADLPVTINGKRTDERVREISENGASILTGSPHPLKTKLAVRIELPEGAVSADAVVIYAKQSDGNGQSGMGLVFEQISPEDQKRIRLFIRNEMSKGIKPLRPAG
jgi:CheY-like chemotaxis protein